MPLQNKENKMKPKRRPAKAGFTIIELLTIMSIIVIIISVLLPALSTINWYAKYTTQRNQFRNIETGLEAYENTYGEYPDSGALDITGAPYCGAMKLAEAMAGQDGLGFHPNSRFTADDGSGQNELYPPYTNQPWYFDNVKKRKEYTEGKDIQIGRLSQMFANNGVFATNTAGLALLSDVYKRELRDSKGNKIGMPILYYKANTTKLLNDVNTPGNPENIYNYLDNQDLLALGVRWDSAAIHPLYQPNSGPGGVPPYAPTGEPMGKTFYKLIQDNSALPIERPHNKNSYILISAGGDGIYGTKGGQRTKDVVNFSD
jgi:type II secretory pathway pseudopilin PulG